MTAGSPVALWSPDEHDLEWAKVTAFARAAEHRAGRELATYDELWRWSTEDLEGFWETVWEHFGLDAQFGDAGRVLPSSTMPGARWFPDTQVNFAEFALRHSGESEAIVDVSEDGHRRTLTFDQLRAEVSAVVQALEAAGVVPGEVVAGYLPNTSHAVVAMLATVSLGAIWSSVGQDYAPEAVLDRFAQLRPKVLIGATAYRYGGRVHSRTADLTRVAEGLPTVELVLVIEREGESAPNTWMRWDSLPPGEAPTFHRVGFDHPLWVLFSSGTTGRPKGIVHGHGGILVESVKQLGLHWDLGVGDRLMWFTSPSWVMWNLQLSALTLGASIVCYDGSPTSPSPSRLWEIAADQQVTFFGTSPGFLLATRKAGVEPGRDLDLTALRAMGSTGSPLSPELHVWAFEHVAEVPLASTSGGTDVAGAFIGGSPLVPIWPGELSVRCLGVAASAWDSDGRDVQNTVGELVVTRPMPSMPVAFWDDADGRRLREAYFDHYPGVWRHGDWITLTERGSVVVHGRSDATLNRQGVRMGSADIYSAVDPLPSIADSLVIGVEYPDGSYFMPMFVVLDDGVELDEGLDNEIRAAIRNQASPRHVPDRIVPVASLPHTRTGKRLEVPIKRIFQGALAAEVLNPDSVDDLDAVGALVDLARTWGTATAPR